MMHFHQDTARSRLGELVVLSNWKKRSTQHRESKETEQICFKQKNKIKLQKQT